MPKYICQIDSILYKMSVIMRVKSNVCISTLSAEMSNYLSDRMPYKITEQMMTESMSDHLSQTS